MRSLTLSAVLVMTACSPMMTADAGRADGSVPDAGRADAGTPDGGQQSSHDGGQQQSSDGGFCAQCVTSADCQAGTFCLGLEPRCGLDCSSGTACPGALTCNSVQIGQGLPLGQNCFPEPSQCGSTYNRAGLNCTDTWANYGNSFVADTCIGSCHRHDTSWTTVSDFRQGSVGIRLSVERGEMPQGQTLSAAERLRLLTFLACGSPD